MATSNDFNKLGLVSRAAHACRHTREEGLPPATQPGLKAWVNGRNPTDQHRFIPLLCRMEGQLLTPQAVWERGQQLRGGTKRAKGSPRKSYCPCPSDKSDVQLHCGYSVPCQRTQCCTSLSTRETGTAST